MEPRNGAVSTSTGDTAPLAAPAMPFRWSLFPGQTSPSGSDWSESKDVHEAYGSPRSVSSSVSIDESSIKSPPRSSSVSSAKSGYTTGDSERPEIFSPQSSTHPRGLKRSVISKIGNSLSVATHGHSESSGDESCGADSPNKPAATFPNIRRVDSPTDSGIESGKEACCTSTPTTSICSSPRALEDKVKDISDSEEKNESIDDMPMLKRALQAPPLVNPSMLMDEAYRNHKKFRASKREATSPTPSTTTHDSLAATHSTLVRTLEAAPRHLNEQQLKRTDLIHSIIMRSESVPSSTSGPGPDRHPFPLQNHSVLSKAPYGHFMPQITSCPYSNRGNGAQSADGLFGQRRPTAAHALVMASSPVLQSALQVSPVTRITSPKLAIDWSSNADGSDAPLNLSMSKRSTPTVAVKTES